MRILSALSSLAACLLVLNNGLSGQDVHRTFDWVAPASASGGFGYLITNLGDVDFDGKDDVAISDPGWGGTRGRVSIVPSSGLPPLTIDGPAPVFTDSFGTTVEVVGDLDLDGAPDLAVGHPSLGAGVLYLVSGATGATLSILSGPTGQTEFGMSVSGFSDLTGDGIGEIIVGMPSINSLGRGLVEVRNGATGSVLFSVVSPLPVTNPTFTNTNWFGANVARLGGDADGDGQEDFVVSDLIAGHVICSGGNGQAIAWSGATPPSAGVRRLRGLGADLDLDGVPEFVCTNPSTMSGEVRSGATGALLRTHAGGPNGLASSAIAAGDLDADGVMDYAFGSASLGPQDGAQVFSGATGNLLWEIVADGAAIGGAVTLDRSPDATGDGYPDLLLASGAFSSAQVARAYSYVRHGRYGFGNGILSLDFQRTGPLDGDLVLTGSTPGSPCLLAVSLLPAQSVFSSPPVSIWVDIDPAALVLLEGFPFPIAPSLTIPIALNDPFVVDVALFFQAFDLSGFPVFATVTEGVFIVFAP